MKGFLIAALLFWPGVAAAQSALTLVPDPAGVCREVNGATHAGPDEGTRSVVLLLPSADQSKRRVHVTLDARGRPLALNDQVFQPPQTVTVQIDPETGILTGERVIVRSSTPVRFRLNSVALDSARALTLEVVRRCGSSRREGR